MTKIDYNPGTHQISGRYFFTDFDRPAVIPTENVPTASGSGNAVRVQNIAVNHTYIFSPTMLLNSTFGWNRQRGGSLSSAPFSFPDAGAKIAATDPPELSIGITGGFGIGTNHIAFSTAAFTIREDLAITKGRMNGTSAARWYASRIILSIPSLKTVVSISTAYTGDGLADFLLGEASGFQPGGGEYKDLLERNGPFMLQILAGQPDIDLPFRTPLGSLFSLLLSGGTRRLFPARCALQRYPNAPAGMIYGGENHDPSFLLGIGKQHMEPCSRLGFAYRLTNDNKTSLRGGIGYYFSLLRQPI